MLYKNLASIVFSLQKELKETGKVMKEHGAMYDEEFPTTLREWFTTHLVEDDNDKSDAASAFGLDEADITVIHHSIVQLIALKSQL